MFRKSLLSLFICLSLVWVKAQELRVGDPGVIFDQAMIDTNMVTWPQVQRWSEAGVRGGIPFMDSLIKGATVTTRTSSGINAAINIAPAGTYVYLPDGEYIISGQVTMKSDVYLVGESREGVVCTITKKDGIAFAFENVQGSGIYNLTIQGGWGTPRYPWNIGEDYNTERPDITNWSVGLRDGTSDCFLDKVAILNSGMHPLRCNAVHCTFRDLVVDGCHNKGGGAQGYFFIQNADNLVTGCFITHLRHISLQGGNVEYNVVYKNKFYQEVSFHHGDNGNNLIEQNEITLPADMWPGYYAIMGPWSIQHDLSHNFNQLYKNRCLELSEGHNNATPWSVDSVVYLGPYEVRPVGAKAIYNNFRNSGLGDPVGGTLYPVTNVVCEEIEIPDFPPSMSFILPTQMIFDEGEQLDVVIEASDDDTLVRVILYLNDLQIGEKTEPPFAWGEDEPALQDLPVGNYTLKAIAEDNSGKTTERIFEFEVVDPTLSRKYVETFSNMSLEGWGTETYTGDNGFFWNVTAKGISGDIDSKGIYFHKGKVGISSGTIQGGIASFSVECLDKWSVGQERIIELMINDSTVGSMNHTGTEQYTFEMDSINVSGDFTLAIKNASVSADNNTISIDNITWHTYVPDTSTVTSSPERLGQDERIVIYPSPFSTHFSVRNVVGFTEMSVMDLTGRVLFQVPIVNMNECSFAPSYERVPRGIYFIVFSGKKLTESFITIRI